MTVWRRLDYGKHTLDEVLDVLEFYVRLGGEVVSITAPCGEPAKPRISVIVDLPLLGTT
jgi:hypothetical protein